MARLIKCILVDVDNLLISEIEEVDAEIGQPNCKLTNPYVFKSIDDMQPLVKVSNTNEYMIRAEDILTIAEPIPEVIEKYLKLTE
jgi:hypothetical protein|tara:strand:+ start:391 stop:645 length:255 start_codon:yes stop_codon:yes gene_type:complete